jgi:CubicO group peptidase (beta-lactamase class C family)
MKKLSRIILVVSIATSGMFQINAQQNNNRNKELFTRIDNYFSAGIKNGFSGAITVVKKGRVIINKGYGVANKKTNSFNNPNTIFDIGSNTKQFTATAILKLIELEKIKLTDPLSKYFKNLPVDKQNITIDQVLSHSAGFLDAIGRDFTKISEKDYFDQLFASKLLSKPGEKYAYSNAGYSILGRIIELVSGQPYESFINTTFFKPAGMLQTGYLLPNWDTKHISRGYNRGLLDSGSPIMRYKEDREVNWHLKGNGGINSTQNDMLLWFKALKSHKILTKESFKKLTGPYIPNPKEKSGYRYGWGIKNYNDTILRLTHNGSNGSFAHSLIWFPEEDIQIIYATNANSSKVESVAYRIAQIVLDKNYVPKPIQNNIFSFTFNYTKENTIKKSSELIAKLKQDYKSDFTHPGVLNVIGNIHLKSNKNLDWALELFKINVTLYPKNGNIWDSLGDGYAANNQKEKAIESYKKAVLLGYKDSQTKINELE